MTDLDNILQTVVLEFPQFKSKITEVYDQSIGFVEVCEDYVICLDAIKELESMNNSKKEKEINDLKHAMVELREELLSKI